MEIGSTSKKKALVTQGLTAEVQGSGSLPVYATPAMVALMEAAAAACVSGALEPGQTTVGIGLSISHSAATPLGMEVTAHARLTQVEGRILSFDIWAEDAAGLIGKGTHQRAVVDAQRFLKKVDEKAAT